MTRQLILLFFLLLLLVPIKCFPPKIKLVRRQCTIVRNLSPTNSHMVLGGILLTAVGSATIFMNAKIDSSNAKIEKDIGELKVDVKDVRTNFNILYAGFGISIALFTGFNAVDSLRNAASVQEQNAKTEKLRMETLKEKES